MRKNKFMLSVIIFMTVSVSHAQTQRGYVKSLGRPNQKGVALSGVTVRVKGEHNTTLSKEDGTFSFFLSGRRNGDAYSLQQVHKTGYELNETGVIGRQYAFSDKVPLTIVMVSSSQLQADKLRISNNAFRVAEKNYKSKLAVLEKQKEGKAISIEKYRSELQDLQNRFEKYQLLIDGLSEHYAHVDYDNLDEKDREINISIEDGDLERADSLLQKLFDPIDVLKRNKDALSRIERQEAEAYGMIEQARSDMLAVLKQQEKDAEYLYQLYTIALSRFDNDKALKYIETRAALDTTNVEWQIEAGGFVREYLADYPKALSYFKLVLCQALPQDGENSEWVSRAYNNIGGVYYRQGDYAKALEYYVKALAVRERILGPDHPENATSYNNIGLVYDSQGDYAKALEYYVKALAIDELVLGPDHPLTATSYCNIGMVYFSQGDYAKALEYHGKALAIDERVLGPDHPHIATSYNNIGLVYNHQGNYAKALEFFSKALAICERTLGPDHPHTATSYNNIGLVYDSQGDYAKTLEYLGKALAIRERVLGPDHPHTASSYDSIGMVYSKQGDYAKALEYLGKALAIREHILGPDHPHTATSYNNIGGVYYRQGDHAKALEYFGRALAIRDCILSPDHPDNATSYNNIGLIYYNQGNYAKALEYFGKALGIDERVFGPDHPSTQTVKENIEYVKKKMNNSYYYK